MKIIIPKTSPKLIKPTIEGLKSFVSTLADILVGFWADTVGTWADSTLTWGTHIEYHERPKIGEVKLKTPTLRHN